MGIIWVTIGEYAVRVYHGGRLWCRVVPTGYISAGLARDAPPSRALTVFAVGHRSCESPAMMPGRGITSRGRVMF